MTGVLASTRSRIWAGRNALKHAGAMQEMVCAESAGVDHFNQNLHPIPQADTPDF